VKKPDNKLIPPASIKSSISRLESRQTEPHVEIDMSSINNTIFMDCSRGIVIAPGMIEVTANIQCIGDDLSGGGR
jgi:hypothetical protein